MVALIARSYRLAPLFVSASEARPNIAPVFPRDTDARPPKPAPARPTTPRRALRLRPGSLVILSPMPSFAPPPEHRGSARPGPPHGGRRLTGQAVPPWPTAQYGA